jgi:hypothetical protein
MENNWNYDDDDDIFAQYLSGQSDLQPKEIALRRKQARVDALRDRSFEGEKGQMIGDVYVAQSPLQSLGQLASGYMGRKGQEGVDTEMSEQDAARKGLRSTMISMLRSRKGSRNDMQMPADETPEEIARRKLMETFSGRIG